MAVLLVSEIFGVSVRHSGSGAPGETVAVIAGDGIVRVEVTVRAAGFSSSPASLCGGAGDGAAGGR